MKKITKGRSFRKGDFLGDFEWDSDEGFGAGFGEAAGCIGFTGEGKRDWSK